MPRHGRNDPSIVNLAACSPFMTILIRRSADSTLKLFRFVVLL